jgi:hypothetical protein
MIETDETAKDIKRLDGEELAEERRRTALEFQADFAPSAALTRRYAALNEAFTRQIYGRGQCARELPDRRCATIRHDSPERRADI